ncbi:unnamed protein product [Didymodactylos carnosus]|uniref:30S ribosomal protein S4 n=1 Tax=Didymodactylos carnosus TaxID=1234261 RepID=A0A8S2EMC8_9BILA|nr:unnamed protein product [Didymodactylos carnosus]CAF4068340.1 unnamed protein product [Didymodactylos carnosus]
MSRFTGSLFKKARRLGFSVLENNKEFSKGKKRVTPPGQHNVPKRKMSDYGQQLQEKQKMQLVYGLTERQLRNTFAKARKMDGILGINFFILLESRLDNLTYRMGFSPTRRGARQLVNHGHVRVNGKKVDIASYICSVNDEISIKDASKGLPLIQVAKDVTFRFVEVDKEKKVGKYVRLPMREELNREITETLVVEWYNRLVK